ncbi:MAG: hypothetical protein WD226_11755 [Planctomycetota bacterium]
MKPLPRKSIQIAIAVLLVGYPILMWFGLERFRVQTLSLAVGIAIVVRLAVRERSSKVEVAGLGALLALLALAAWFSESERFLMFLPAVISAALGVAFALSLRAGTESWVERLARETYGTSELPPTARAYCRRVTGIWTAFFFVNASIAASLAAWGPVAWWALYSGFLAYGMMGLVMAVEYIYRRAIVAPVADREAAALGIQKRGRRAW